MIISLWLFFTSLIILKEVSCVKFGFIFKDEDEILGQRIVIFGKVPSDLSNTEKAIINDDMNKFHNFYRKNKKSKGLKGRMKFVADLGLNAVNSEGNSQVTVTGELSNFMNHLRLSVLNSLGSADIWKRVKFYSEPVSILSRSDFLRCGPLKDFSQAHAKIEISLNRAVFAKGQILANQFLWEIDYTTSIQEAVVSGVQYFDISGFVDKEMKYSVLEYYSLDLKAASIETDTGTTENNQSDSKSSVNDYASDLVKDSDIIYNDASNKIPSVNDNTENGVLPSIYGDLTEIDLRSSDKEDSIPPNHHNSKESNDDHINTSDPEKSEEIKETKKDDDKKAAETDVCPIPSHNNVNELSDRKDSVDPETNSSDNHVTQLIITDSDSDSDSYDVDDLVDYFEENNPIKLIEPQNFETSSSSDDESDKPMDKIIISDPNSEDISPISPYSPDSKCSGSPGYEEKKDQNYDDANSQDKDKHAENDRKNEGNHDDEDKNDKYDHYNNSSNSDDSSFETVIISPVQSMSIDHEESSEDEGKNSSENSSKNDHNDHIYPNNDEITIIILKPRRVRCCSFDCCSVS